MYPPDFNLQFVFPDRICVNEKITFENTSVACDTNTNFVWNFGDSTPVSADPSHTYTKAGTFRVKLFIPGLDSCPDREIIKSIDVIDCPEFNCPGRIDSCFSCSFLGFNFSRNVCVGKETVFENRSTGCSSNTGFIWNFGDLSPSSTNPVHTYTHAGRYIVKLITPQRSGCPERFISDTINVMNCVKTDSCEGLAVKIVQAISGNNRVFTATVTGGTAPYQYSWTTSANLSPFSGQGTNKITTPMGQNGAVYSVTVTVKDRHNCSTMHNIYYPGN